jgi:hypothetical protein
VVRGTRSSVWPAITARIITKSSQDPRNREKMAL